MRKKIMKNLIIDKLWELLIYLNLWKLQSLFWTLMGCMKTQNVGGNIPTPSDFKILYMCL